jgi:hypothetical protein
LPVEVAGDVALEASLDLAVGLSFGPSPFGVGAGGWVVVQACEDDDVDRSVELAVTATVDPMSGGEPGRRGNGGDTSEAGERGFAATATGVRPRVSDLQTSPT